VPNVVSFADSTAELGDVEKSHTHSLTHSTSLPDDQGTEAFTLEQSSETDLTV